MDLSTGLSVAGIGTGAVVSLLAMKPMNPAVRKGLIGFGCLLIAVGIWGILGHFSVKGEADAQKPSVSIEQTNPYQSPNVVGDHNQLTINPDVNPNAPTVTYDFNGMKRTIDFASGLTVRLQEETPQVQAYKKMAKLEDGKDWVALRDLCEQEIKKTPEWLTPALFAGKAYAVLGDTDKAIERLDYVHRKSAGREDYKVGDQLRELIRQQTGR